MAEGETGGASAPHAVRFARLGPYHWRSDCKRLQIALTYHGGQALYTLYHDYPKTDPASHHGDRASLRKKAEEVRRARLEGKDRGSIA